MPERDGGRNPKSVAAQWALVTALRHHAASRPSEQSSAPRPVTPWSGTPKVSSRPHSECGGVLPAKQAAVETAPFQSAVALEVAVSVQDCGQRMHRTIVA
eukprot:1290471-Rhodomonas_salina.1